MLFFSFFLKIRICFQFYFLQHSPGSPILPFNFSMVAVQRYNTARFIHEGQRDSFVAVAGIQSDCRQWLRYREGLQSFWGSPFVVALVYRYTKNYWRE